MRPHSECIGSAGACTDLVLPSLDQLKESSLVVIPEGWVAHQQDVQDHTAGPQVHGAAIGLLTHHLRGQVARGASKPCREERVTLAAHKPDQ